MNHGSGQEEELGTLIAQKHVAHHQQVNQVYQQVDQQVWVRMILGSSCLFLGLGPGSGQTMIASWEA